MTSSRIGYSLLTWAALQALAGSVGAQAAVVPAVPLNSGTAAPAPLGNAQVAATAARTGVTVDEATREDARAQEPEAKPRIIQGNDQVIAPARPIPQPSGAPLTFSFEDAPVADVVRTLLGDIMGVPYVLHPPIAGTVTLASRTAIAPDQAVFLLESALQANGLALTRDARGIYHVGRTDTLRGIGSDVRQAPTPRTQLAPGYGVVIIPLKYIGAGEMATILRPLVGQDAIVRVDSIRNLLVMNGTRTQAEGWLEMVNTFDVDLLKGMSVGLFPLKYASIAEVETALRLVSGGGGAAQGAGGAAAGSVPQNAAAGQTAAGGAGANAGAAAAMLGEGNPFFGALRIMPVARLNSVLVVTPRAEYLEQARQWIEKLDQPNNGGGGAQLFIYRVQNGNAVHLASVLNGIFGGTTPTNQQTANSGVAPGLNTTAGGMNSYGSNQYGNGGFGNNSFGNSGFGNNSFGNSGGGFGRGSFGGGSGFQGNSAFGNRSGNYNQNQNQMQQQPATAIGGLRVMADQLNNSLLVWGTRDEFSKIESTLKRLDLPPTQVLIEASIVEVTLDDTLQYGLEWAFSGGAGRYNGAGQLSSGFNRPAVGPSLAANAGEGFSYSLTNSLGNVRMVLKALAEKTAVKMISSPSLMVLDNHTALMAVGDQIPVASSTTNTDLATTTTTTVQYRDTGVNLAVTPSVNAGNLVTMQIDQTVTDSRGVIGGTTAQPTFTQRQLSSKVAVRSGETIVLGGLIKDNQKTGKTGFPLLQDIPVVGNLFSTNSNEGSRTELLVVITPRVVRTDPEIRDVSEDLRERLKGLKVLELKESGRMGTPAAPLGRQPYGVQPQPPQ